MKTKSILLFLPVLLFISCKPKVADKLVKFDGLAQGTYYAVTYYSVDGTNYQPQIDSILKDFDKVASLWVPESEISRINRHDSTLELSDRFIDLFNKSKEVSEKTDGVFDFTIGQLVNAWGFGFTNRTKLDPQKVDSLRKYVDYKSVSIEGKKVIEKIPEIRFDFNAIAQGYSVDMLAEFLHSKGIENYLIDVGGEVLAQGKKPDGSLWVVGIEKPSKDANEERVVQFKVQTENKALATSGSYRKFYEENGIRYSHTIDPRTGYPVTHTLLSVSVMADKCWEADAYATAFMVMGLDKAKEYLEKNKQLEAHFIYSLGGDSLASFTTPGLKQKLEEVK